MPIILRVLLTLLSITAIDFTSLPIIAAVTIQDEDLHEIRKSSASILETDKDIEELLQKLMDECGQGLISPDKRAPQGDGKASQEAQQPTPVPGLVAAFQRFGQPMRIAAVGERKWESNIPLTVNDVVHLGSCTKAMTATMIGRLVDRGQLKFSTTIREGLPHLLESIHSDYHDVTLLQLLTHRASAPRDGPWYLQKGETLTQRREAIVQQAMSKPPASPPGSQYSYSNLGYVVAALFAVHREGVSWEELMKRELFVPLGLDSGGFGPPGTIGEVDQPWGHLAFKKVMNPLQRDNPAALGPAGTIHMTISDWAKFAFVHAGCHEHDFLSDETLRILHQPVPSQDKKSPDYACGWIVTDRPWANGRVLAHNGSNTLWYCSLWIAPNTKTVYFSVCNAGTGRHVPKVVDRAIRGLIRLNDQELPRP